MSERAFRIILSPRGGLLTLDRAAGAYVFGNLSATSVNIGVAGGGHDVVAVEPAGGPLPNPRLRVEPQGDGRSATLVGAGVPEGVTVMLADAAVLARLRDLAAGTWLRQVPNTPENPVALHRGLTWPAAFVACVGQVHIDLAASHDLLAKAGDPDALFVLDGAARLEQLIRFDPVVAYTAFGPSLALFRCLEASLYSLARVACYDGKVVILSDRDRADVEFLVPGELRGDVHYERVTVTDVLDMAMQRYVLPLLAPAATARPLLYVDTDVVFDAPIERLLAEILLAQRPCVFAEDDLLHPMDFYGGVLIGADPGFKPAHRRGFSAGVLGLPDPAAMVEPFRALAALVQAQTRRDGRRQFTSYDQRFLNYLFHKLVDYDDTTLGRHETYCNNVEPDLTRRLGIAHFAGGVGNAEPKLTRMTAYLDMLTRAGPPA